MNGVDGGTSLALIHAHTLLLGMIFFLILSLFEDKFQMSTYKSFKTFNIFYHTGLMTTVAMFLVRGILEVLDTNISNGLDSALSGIAGLGHIFLSVGIITILLILNKASRRSKYLPKKI